jgi:hypothetical protein
MTIHQLPARCWALDPNPDSSGSPDSPHSNPAPEMKESTMTNDRIRRSLRGEPDITEQVRILDAIKAESDRRAERALSEHVAAVKGENPSPEPGTAYHETVTDFRRELIESHLEWTKMMAPYRDAVFTAQAARKQDPEAADVPDSVRDAYVSSLMAAGYSYTLAAVLERAMKLDPEIGETLACIADSVLTNGGDEDICADVWPESAKGSNDD